MDTKAFKRSLQHSENYHRKGFGHQAEVASLLQSEYQSNLVQQIRDNNYTLQNGDVTIRLAEAFGFCWGVGCGEFHRIWVWGVELRILYTPHPNPYIPLLITHNPSTG